MTYYKEDNKMDHILVVDSAQHQGTYVATSGLGQTDVVCSANKPMVAFRQAQAQGIARPVVIYVPTEEEIACHYHHHI